MESKPIKKSRFQALSSKKKRLVSLGIIALLAISTVGISRYFIATAPKAKKAPPVVRKTAVEIIKLKRADHQTLVNATGTIKPAQEITLTAQVAGAIKSIHPDLEPGGLLKEGQVVVELDDYEFLLTENQRRSDYISAEADLKIELGRQRVARREWDLIQSATHKSLEAGKNTLALRKPQLAQAQGKLDKAKADWQKAKLNRERSKITIPFNAIVRELKVGVGSVVNATTPLATLAGTDRYWLELTVPLDQLSMIHGSNAPVEFIVTAGTLQDHQYRGKVIRIMSDVQKNGLLAQILVEVLSPLVHEEGYPPLILGSYVNAKIQGKTLPASFRVPRKAVRDNNSLMLATEGKLEIRKVEPIWKTRDWVYLSKGLKENEMLIVSNVPGALEGMPVVPQEVEQETKIIADESIKAE